MAVILQQLIELNITIDKVFKVSLKRINNNIMELITKPTSDFLLNGSIEALHHESREWLNDIEFWKDELAFFYALTVKKTLKGVPDSLKSQAIEIEKELIKISGGELDRMHQQVFKHEQALGFLLESKREDEQKYREQHKEIETTIERFENRFKTLKKEVFKMVESLDEMLNDTIRIIYDRRAVRKYKDKPVDRKLIEKIIDAGKMAPSAINKQPWKFYVLIDKKQIKSFSDEIAKVAEHHFHLSHGINIFKTEDPIFYNAPVVIYITAPKDDDYGMLDIGLCAENMMLAAKSMDLDSCPVGLAKFIEQTDLYPQLNIPKTDSIALAVIIGYGNEVPKVHDRVLDNVIYL